MGSNPISAFKKGDIKIPGYYELQKKLNHLKDKNKKEIHCLKNKIKKQNKFIEALEERNKNLRTREMYQTWLKEREKLISQFELNNKLLDENIKLKEKLIFTIKKGALILKIKKESEK